MKGETDSEVVLVWGREGLLQAETRHQDKEKGTDTINEFSLGFTPAKKVPFLSFRPLWIWSSRSCQHLSQRRLLFTFLRALTCVCTCQQTHSTQSVLPPVSCTDTQTNRYLTPSLYFSAADRTHAAVFILSVYTQTENPVFFFTAVVVWPKINTRKHNIHCSQCAFLTPFPCVLLIIWLMYISNLHIDIISTEMSFFSSQTFLSWKKN